MGATPEHVWSALGVRQLIPTGHVFSASSLICADCGSLALPSQTLVVQGMHGDHQHGKDQWRSSSASRISPWLGKGNGASNLGQE